MTLERTIPLGDVKGRIDHLAVDLGGERLFVAELANDTVSVIDLRSHTVRQRIVHLREPQGLCYLPSKQTLYVANGGDGSVRCLTGDPLRPCGTVKLDADADNVRLDPKTSTLFVGHGSGAIAVLNLNSWHQVRDIELQGHPESFQISSSGDRLYINVPEAHHVVVADPQSGRIVDTIAARGARSNFPMALDEGVKRLLVAFRDPPVLRLMALDDQRFNDVETCRDADDVFVDHRRHRIYVICGQGAVDVLNDGGSRIDRIATSPGARTGLFVPELDRLFVAVPAHGSATAEVQVLRPPRLDSGSTTR